MVEDGAEDTTSLLLVTLIVLVLDAFHEVCLGTLKLRGSEAVLLHAFVLGHDGVQGFVDAVFVLGHSGTHPSILGVADEEGAIVAATIDEGRVGLLGQLFQAVVVHGGHQLVDIAFDPILHIASFFERHDVVLVEHRNVISGLFGVGADADDGLGVVCHLETDTLGRVDGSRDVFEDALQMVLHLVDVDVTDDDDALEVGTVPLVVVGAQGLMVEAADDFLGADGQAMAVGAVGVDLGKHLLVDAHLGALALLKDDTALLVDLLAFKRDEARPVVENEDARVDEVHVGGRNVGEHVDGLLDAGPGVDILAELHAVVLHVVEQCLAGEVLRAVEGHVLQEVGQTLLVVFFKDGADLLRDVEVGALGGFLVMTDVVGQSVLQFASSDIRVEGHGHGLLSEHRNAQCKHGD